MLQRHHAEADEQPPAFNPVAKWNICCLLTLAISLTIKWSPDLYGPCGTEASVAPPPALWFILTFCFCGASLWIRDTARSSSSRPHPTAPASGAHPVSNALVRDRECAAPLNASRSVHARYPLPPPTHHSSPVFFSCIQGDRHSGRLRGQDQGDGLPLLADLGLQREQGARMAPFPLLCLNVHPRAALLILPARSASAVPMDVW